MDNGELQRCYETYVDMVYKICLVLLKNVPDAEDATQSVFLKRMERGPFDSPEHEKGWLIVTARNQCRDMLRHWWRKRRSDLESLPEPAAPAEPEGKWVWEQVAALPPDFRMVIYLYYYEGYRTGEIAALLGEKPATVRARLCKARKRLKLEMEEAEA